MLLEIRHLQRGQHIDLEFLSCSDGAALEGHSGFICAIWCLTPRISTKDQAGH